MYDDDHDYLSGMTSAALAVMMVVVMFWIRSSMPDDAADVAEPTVQAADNTVQAATLHTAMRGDGASVLQSR